MLDASGLQQKLSQIEKIGTLLRIFSLKRKADSDYRLALEQVNVEVNRYLEIQPGFLQEMMKSFQSLLAITHTHKTTLLDGYENEVLRPLALAKDRRVDESIIKKVQFTEGKVNSQISQIQEKITRLKSITDEIQFSKTQTKLKDRIGGMSQSQTIQHSSKLRESYHLLHQTQSSLQKSVSELQSLSQLYTQTKTDLEQYESQYFSSLAQDVTDQIMRIFVLEVAYIRCTEHDVAAILKRLKENRDQCKKGSRLEGGKGGGMGENIGNIRAFLWDTYKSMTRGEVKYNQSYVPESIRKKIDQVFASFKQ